ncbi:MAG: hypothetical protein UW07_C0019G0016 [Candidatus Nomurabacteria bacterium GW2011_GWF2_43_8]|uniref:DUF8033 domain-containing protein n=1 Tax=Candidatus Nomurabacteria bacterium GW2011_GWF2_43_8 TaxID=1618779 RepID=A0A0G1HWC2_9BACT|nr:MAG: hypothetical protein UW07_C0019G0016 [Candidatus Nomurabacteria bacterium GW2011_GWF2_43_8]
MKYKKNLHVEGSKVFSYSTHVATIDRASGKLYVHGYWSMTTSKHINHVADVLGLHKEDKARDVAEVEAERKAKESNDWKARMLRAGLEGRGLIMPDDWDTLPEAEKTKRLDGALANLTK